MKKQVTPVMMAGAAVALILLIIGIVVLISNLTPSKERMNLSEYYKITEDNQVAITVNGTVYETYGTLINDHVYLDYKFVHDHINSRFYWDANENILLYTTANDVISAKAEATSYYIGKSSKDFDREIVKATADSALIAIDFINTYSNITYTYYDSPSRIVITNISEDITVATVKKNTQLRFDKNIKSPILCDIQKNNTVTILETGDKWSLACSEDGILGYIRSNTIKDIQDISITDTFKEEFLHIVKEEPVNLLWHQTTSSSGNAKIATLLSSTKGVNVISPTWFQVKDKSGELISFASKDYVTYCHDHNVDVWALVSNFESLSKEDTVSLLTHTSSRQNLVNQLIAVALQYNLDGINVDFEEMSAEDIGDSYIQFIRELSIKCENNDIVLSVDVPVPESHNDFYEYAEQSLFADYIILMAYNQHWGPSSGAGSVAAINWVDNMVSTSLELGVPSEQLVLGVPFYSRLWNLTPTSEGSEDEVEYLVGCETIYMDDAKTWMKDNVGEPIWLEDCGQWYGETTKNGVIYKLWQEDVTSLEERLKLMQKHSLAGAAFWKYGQESSDVWDTIIKYIN